MKKLSLISMGLVLLMAMTQCKKQETPSANDNEGEKVHITLEVDNGSKNLVHPETGTAFFTNGDKVLVANNNHYVGTLTYEGNNHHFSGDITGAVESDYLHFYFMGNQDLVEGTPSSSTTSFTVNISDQTNCYPQIAYAPSSVKYAGEMAYKACLLNQCALVKFTTNEINVETVVTVSGLNNQVSVDLGSKEFTFSQTNGGNIALHAESTTSRWAILLPQTDLSSVTANAFGFDEASVSFDVPSINENDYLTGGASFTMTCPALTFKARTAGVSVAINNASAIDLQFSRDGVNWENYTSAITLTNVGDIVSFRGNNTMFSASNRKFTCSNGQCYIYGNVMSLLHANDYASNYELSDKAFTYLFDSNQNIDIDPDKELVLPALVLAPNCYQNMFRNCTGLTKAPALPATKLASYCYNQMFQGCTSLQTAPALPATKLAQYCYQTMFQNCSSLTTAPALPATELADYCYQYMFQNCSSLTTAPALPATKLIQSCYSYMFYGCTGLQTAPALPATTLANFCYHNMFNGCTGLQTAPDLPATTLANSCYSNMFQNCSGLQTAPAVLPATELASSCYNTMFQGCSKLTTAPVLPATTLVSTCYNYMFRDCTQLSSITCLATSGIGSSSCNTWVNNVASTGTFTKAAGVPVGSGTAGQFWPTGNNVYNGIPANWTVNEQ